MLQIELRKLSDLKPHPDNPRKTVPGGIQKLAESIKGNPNYFQARPIVLSNRTGELVIIDGERRSEAAAYLRMEYVPTILIEGLSYDEEKEILIKGNTHTGIWDEIKLAKWPVEQLKDWNVEHIKLLAKEQAKKATEMLSELEYKGLYYQPKYEPDISLDKCVDLEKFQKKLQVIEDSKLPKKKKDLLKWFAYRFIRIDFESVANYYAFKASEEERRVIERLRLVLVDGGGKDSSKMTC